MDGKNLFQVLVGTCFGGVCQAIGVVCLVHAAISHCELDFSQEPQASGPTQHAQRWAPGSALPHPQVYQS